MVDDKVIAIVKEARKWIENIAMLSTSHYVDPKTLCGFCGIGAAYLFKLLKDAGYSPKIVVNDTCHCFVKLNEGLDITATQFNKPPIYTTKTFKGYWKIDQEFDTLEEFMKWQIDWPIEQQAKTFLSTN